MKTETRSEIVIIPKRLRKIRKRDCGEQSLFDTITHFQQSLGCLASYRSNAIGYSPNKLHALFAHERLSSRSAHL